MSITGFYQATLRAICQANQIIMDLWYAYDVASGFPAGPVYQTGVLADELNADVIPPRLAILNPAFAMQDIQINVFNNVGLRLNTSPLVYPSTGEGESEGTLEGVARVAPISFTLGARETVTPGEEGPTQGYVAHGPLDTENVTGDGKLEPSFLASGAFLAWRAALAASLSDTENSAFWRPIRVRKLVVPEAFDRIAGYALITGTRVNSIMRFRKSRLFGS